MVPRDPRFVTGEAERTLNLLRARCLFARRRTQWRISSYSGTAVAEATARELKSKGVEFVMEPKREDWGTAAAFKDVDGNTFVLSSK